MHKKLRHKRLAPVLIKVGACGVFELHSNIHITACILAAVSCSAHATYM